MCDPTCSPGARACSVSRVLLLHSTTFSLAPSCVSARRPHADRQPQPGHTRLSPNGYLSCSSTAYACATTIAMDLHGPSRPTTWRFRWFRTRTSIVLDLSHSSFLLGFPAKRSQSDTDKRSHVFLQFLSQFPLVRHFRRRTSELQETHRVATSQSRTMPPTISPSMRDIDQVTASRFTLAHSYSHAQDAFPSFAWRCPVAQASKIDLRSSL